MDSLSKEYVLLPLDRAGHIAHSILIGLTLCHPDYKKVYNFMCMIESYLNKRGFINKKGIIHAKFTPSEVKFLKTFYERKA